MTIADKPWLIPVSEEDPAAEGVEKVDYTAQKINMGGDTPSVCYYLTADVLGRGDGEIGADLLQKFFAALCDKGIFPQYLVLVNSAVLLSVKESPILSSLQTLERGGTTILVSAESADFYEVRTSFQVGKLKEIGEIILVLHGTDKVITL